MIISYNSAELTCNCIKSIYDTCDFEIDICVVDNNSVDNTKVQIQSEYPNVRFIENNKNLGYSKAVNIGVNSKYSDISIISNADVIYKPNSIKYLIDYLIQNPKIASVGPAQYFLNGKRQYSFGLLPSFILIFRNFLFIQPILNRIKTKKAKKVDYLDGAVIAVRTDVFKTVGGFSEEFFFYSEDADYCRKLSNAGFYNIHLPYAEVIHLRGASTNVNGININALDIFVKAKIQLTKKYLNPALHNLYYLSELFNNIISEKLFNIIYSVKKSPQVAYKSEYYNKLCSAWQSNIKALKNK